MYQIYGHSACKSGSDSRSQNQCQKHVHNREREIEHKTAPASFASGVESMVPPGFLKTCRLQDLHPEKKQPRPGVTKLCSSLLVPASDPKVTHPSDSLQGTQSLRLQPYLLLLICKRMLIVSKRSKFSVQSIRQLAPWLHTEKEKQQHVLSSLLVWALQPCDICRAQKAQHSSTCGFS